MRISRSAAFLEYDEQPGGALEVWKYRRPARPDSRGEGTVNATPEPAPADGALLADLSMRFRPALNHYFMRRRLRPEDAEDAVQEVFVRLSRRQGLAGLENVEGYLFETAASVAVDHHRRRRVRSEDRHDPYDETRHAVSDFASDRVLEGKQELAMVLAGLRELPERTRHVFLLARLERMRHAEIGRRLGISVSTVEKHVVKALVHLSHRIRETRS